MALLSIVSRKNGIALALQPSQKHVPVHFVIFDEQDFGHLHFPWS
jgi:hypothetical protein